MHGLKRTDGNALVGNINKMMSDEVTDLIRMDWSGINVKLHE